MSEGSPFSVLLACYDGDDPEHLRASLRSVTVDQIRRPDEVVVVVDGPIRAELDAEIVSAYRTLPVPLVVHRLSANRGLGPALNAGLAICRHEIVARQDADDISLPERFARQVPVVEAGVDVVGCALVEFTSSLKDVGAAPVVRVPPIRPEAIARSARFHQPVFHPSVVYRRSAVRAVGGYEDLPLLEDYWLFGRMVHAGARIANLPEPLVGYRVGGGAYARRGGVGVLRSELDLQRRFRQLGFTTTVQYARNIAVRGGYRLIPEGLRRGAYLTFLRDRGRR